MHVTNPDIVLKMLHLKAVSIIMCRLSKQLIKLSLRSDYLWI